jgi:AcrR family transcriptional regulator
MEDLAQVLGLRRGSLYTHISAKEELLVATVEHGAEAFGRALDAAEAGTAAPPERLRAMLRAHIGVLASEPDAAACFLWEWRHLDGSHRDRAIELRDGYERRVRRSIEAGIDDGAFREDLDAGFATLAFLSVGNWASTWLRPAGRLAPADVADRLFGVLADGLLQHA